MSKPLDRDLRVRLVAAVEGGMSCRATARHFRVSDHMPTILDKQRVRFAFGHHAVYKLLKVRSQRKTNLPKNPTLTRDFCQLDFCGYYRP